jgi:hypothetical protein
MIAALSRSGCQDYAPIFVVGMPRSGTTLVEQILSCHSAVCGLGEREDIDLVVASMRSQLASKLQYPACLIGASRERIHIVARSLAQRLKAEVGSDRRPITKRPEDFWDLGLIAILFPKARIVHCQRDPIDTCLSCYMQNFAQIPFATSLSTLVEVYRLYQRIMQHWRATLPTSAIYELSYETFVRQPEESVRKLTDFCGIPFEDTCVRFHENHRPVQTVSRVLTLACALLGSVCGWAYLHSGSGNLVLPYLEGERLLVEPTAVMLGNQKANEVVESTIKIVNATNRDVSILGAQRSCGCIAVDEFPCTIASGQSRRLRIKLHVDTHPGDFEQSVKFFTDYADVPMFVVTLNGVAR